MQPSAARNMSASGSLTVITAGGQQVSVGGLLADSPLAALKGMLVGLTGVPYPAQRVVFAGNELKDDVKSLASYGVVSGTTLHLIADRGADAAAVAPPPTLPPSAPQPTYLSAGVLRFINCAIAVSPSVIRQSLS